MPDIPTDLNCVEHYKYLDSNSAVLHDHTFCSYSLSGNGKWLRIGLTLSFREKWDRLFKGV